MDYHIPEQAGRERLDSIEHIIKKHMLPVG
jgi:hypothetical protein